MRTALLLPLLILVGCTTANLGPGAAERQTQTRTFGASPEDAFRAAAQVAATMAWTIHESDASTGIISASTPETMGRWGDDVSVIVAAEGAGSRVTVRSQLANPPNARYIGEYLDAVAAALN